MTIADMIAYLHSMMAQHGNLEFEHVVQTNTTNSPNVDQTNTVDVKTSQSP